MSHAYAEIAALVLEDDATLDAWATGGILTYDPRRSGPNATGDSFDLTEMGDIKPTIAVVGGNATRTLGGPQSAYQGTVAVRIFAPDYHRYHAEVDVAVERITSLLFGYQHSTEGPAIFRWDSRLGIQSGGAWEDVIYDEVRFRLIGLHEGVPT